MTDVDQQQQQQDEINQIKEITELYFDIFENHKETLVYYLSESATLDWFGQTVKGQKDIITFVKTKVGKIKHEFANPTHVTNIGYRDTHVINTGTDSKKSPITKIEDDLVVQNKDVMVTNEDLSLPSSSHFIEKGQGDGLHNCPVLSESPIKKCRLNAENNVTSLTIQCISATGHVVFHRKSMKKLQNESKWLRPCKLEFAYSGTNKKDFVLYLIIYQGNTTCRRNLLKEFEASETSSN